MNKDFCLKKFEEMADQVKEHLLEKANQLLRTGALNIEDYGDNYTLPKILLVAALEYEADQWRPIDKKYQRVIKKLSHF